MCEGVYAGKYEILPKLAMVECENIRALAWLMDVGDIDVKSVERILSDQVVLTTGSTVIFVLAVDSLFNFVHEWVVNSDKLNVAALCKMHKMLKGEWDITAGVLRQGYRSTDITAKKYATTVSKGELKERLEILQSNLDKKKAAKDIFMFVVESAPFYEGNAVVAFMAAECILVKYDVGYLDFSCAECMDRLHVLISKAENCKFSSKDRHEMSILLDGCIRK